MLTAHLRRSQSTLKDESAVKALRSKQFQTRDIVQRINAKGVDFQLTPAVEGELVAAGARPPVIEAVRTNYRAAAPVSPQPARNSATTNANFTGTPLGKDAVVALLQNGVKLQKFSDEIMNAAHKDAQDLYAEESAKNPAFKKIFTEWDKYRKTQNAWFSVAEMRMDSFNQTRK